MAIALIFAGAPGGGRLTGDQFWMLLFWVILLFSVFAFYHALTQAKVWDSRFLSKMTLYLTGGLILVAYFSDHQTRFLELSILPGLIAIAGVLVSSWRFRK
jgi:hypothetical protein